MLLWLGGVTSWWFHNLHSAWCISLALTCSVEGCVGLRCCKPLFNPCPAFHGPLQLPAYVPCSSIVHLRPSIVHSLNPLMLVLGLLQLPVYVPCEAERSDSALFAANVRTYMVRQLDTMQHQHNHCETGGSLYYSAEPYVYICALSEFVYSICVPWHLV